MGYVLNKKYYTGNVYEWNLPTGSTCPFADQCKVTVDRATGKFNTKKGEYRCYAANPERFPGVREHRWKNFETSLHESIPEPPAKCKAIRIHAAGDFYNQEYFDKWIHFAQRHKHIEIWAYTKSVNYWINRITEIPENLTLTASYGGRLDELIEIHQLKNVKIYPSLLLVPPDRPVDTNDDYARIKGVNFALIDNFLK